jgi:hypothetical protein
MGDAPEPGEIETRALLELAGRHAFGPLLFLGQLAAFVRERCPDPKEGLPQVELRLHDGTAIDVCHVIGVGPRWVVIAAHDPEAKGRMQTVLLPYEAIVRVTIRSAGGEGRGVGFEQHRAPAILEDSGGAAEDALRAAARRPEPRTAENLEVGP